MRQVVEVCPECKSPVIILHFLDQGMKVRCSNEKCNWKHESYGEEPRVKMEKVVFKEDRHYILSDGVEW